MLKGIKSRNSVADAIKYSSIYNINVAARPSAVLTGALGVDDINIAPDNVPTTPSLCYREPKLKQLPRDESDYKLLTRQYDKLLIKKPYNFAIENEWTYSYDYDLTDAQKLDIVTKMTIYAYRYWTPKGVIISDSGTPMAIGEGLVYRYYSEVKKDTKRADNFLTRLGDTVINIPATDLVLQEIDIYRKAGITSMMYQLHLHCTDETIGCIPDILEAAKYYTTGIGTVAVNELSFKNQDAQHVKSAMSHLKGKVPYVCAYSAQSGLLADGTYWTNEFTNEMLDAFFL
jgi:hypothetical protein